MSAPESDPSAPDVVPHLADQTRDHVVADLRAAARRLRVWGRRSGRPLIADLLDAIADDVEDTAVETRVQVVFRATALARLALSDEEAL